MGFFNEMNAESDNKLTERKKAPMYETPYDDSNPQDEVCSDQDVDDDSASEELNALLSGSMSSFTEGYDEDDDNYDEDEFSDESDEDASEYDDADSNMDDAFRIDSMAESNEDFYVEEKDEPEPVKKHKTEQESYNGLARNTKATPQAVVGKEHNKSKAPVSEDSIILTIPNGFIFNGSITGCGETKQKKVVEVFGSLRGPVADVQKLVIHTGGELLGDVQNVERIKIEGKLHGNVKCGSVSVADGKITGEICANSVDIKRSAMVIGNIHGSSLSLSGAVKGNICMDESVSLESTAVVKGDIKGKSLSIHPGSKVSGTCTALADEAAFDIFDEEDDNE